MEEVDMAALLKRLRSFVARHGGKTRLQMSAEKALRMKQAKERENRIPEHRNAVEGGVPGPQVGMTDTGVGVQSTATPNLKRSHVARTGDT
jgi:hypothetical protein